MVIHLSDHKTLNTRGDGLETSAHWEKRAYIMTDTQVTEENLMWPFVFVKKKLLTINVREMLIPGGSPEE